MEPSILLIDDDEDDCLMMKNSLYQVGVRSRIDIAFGGEQALQMLEQMKSSLPALIILDLNMPQMNGLDVLEKIRDKFQIPVILYTTSCTDDVTRKAKELGAVDCVKKGTSYTDNLKFAKRVFLLLKKL